MEAVDDFEDVWGEGHEGGGEFGGREGRGQGGFFVGCVWRKGGREVNGA